MIRDSFDRPLHDLRISVIDRCNFRCPYCMPEKHYADHYSFLEERLWLRFDEIVRITKLFVELGVSKIRLTGGEPLLRPDLSKLVALLAQVPGIDDLALTTNGSLLDRYAADLKKAGLHRITVSLDALDDTTFQEMNGGKGNVSRVLQGIRAAESAGFANIKLNVVVQRGINEDSVIELVRAFKGSGHILRFIEYMDVGNCNHWEAERVLPNNKLLKMIHTHFPVVPADPHYFGEVAKRYLFSDGSGEIGFISSISQPFCGSCTRARLATDGQIYTCLFARHGIDLRRSLRAGLSDEDLLQIIRQAWHKRADKYSENRKLFRSLNDKPLKVEMYQIGG